VNSFAVNRTQFLIGTTVFLLVFAIVYHIWANWGLITIHAKQEPLAKVIASMQRQGHAKIETDIPLDTPVTMDVVKAPLPDALETLAVCTDARWRLLYFVAGDKATLKTGEATWFGGQRPDGWRMVSFPMGNMIPLDDDPPPMDPRQDVWQPKTAAPAPVQTFFAEAAQLTNAGFAFPADWNPTVTSTPPSGVVDHVVPKLIKAASGHEDELFFVSKGHRGNRGDFAGGDFHFNPDMFAEKIQAEINRLPPEEKSEAQANFDTEKAFRDSLKDLSDEQRRAAWMQHMQDPQVQQAIANRMDSRDARMGHDQRMQHWSNYVNRKLAATGKM
jgi:hypothetical protein